MIRGYETITATVTIENTGNVGWTFYVGASSREPGDGAWHEFTPFRAAKTLSLGQSGSVEVRWSPGESVPVGAYAFYSKVFKYSSGTDYFDDEWWPSAFTVVAEDPDAEITDISFDRTEVIRGNETITATVTIENTGNVTWTFYVGASSREPGDGAWHEFTPFRAATTLSPGQSGSVTVRWSPDESDPVGAYAFYSKVFKYNSGTDYFDDEWWPSAFTVLPENPNAEITDIEFTPSDREVIRGRETITATVTIRNTGNVGWTFYVGASGREPGDGAWHDFSPSRVPKTLNPGQSGSVEVSWSPGGSVPTGA